MIQVTSHFRKVKYLSVITALISISACTEADQKPAAGPALLSGSSRLSDLLGDEGLAGYPKADRPRAFRFPQDHGPHPDFRNEWWYLTGNLDGAGGERFGFELTFFRFSVSPPGEDLVDSAWRTNQVYVAHFAISDVDEDRFHLAQRYSRGSVGLAGARAGPFAVWLEDWRLAKASSGDHWTLVARDDDFGIDLEFLALKDPVLNGDRGLSQKSTAQGNASYYYSMPRLQTGGTVTVGNRTVDVSGLSWLDREWSSSALSAEQRGWDWFALQLSDGTDLMFYQLRRNDGSIDLHSAGTWVGTDGRSEPLHQYDVSVTVTDRWVSPRGTEYPSAWHLDVPKKNLSLDISSAMADQELVTNVSYWEGAVNISGNSGEKSVSGRGYVELTGYAE